MNITIRPERPGDYAAILRLTYEAFLTLDYPGRRRMDEHYLVHLLQNCEYVIPELCFVAEADTGNSLEIVGHILYTKSAVIRADTEDIRTVTFGPLSVLPKYHRQGIGRLLVEHSMNKAKELGFGAVVITGVPAYYPKLGFVLGRQFGLTLPDDSADDAFMVYELTPGALAGKNAGDGKRSPGTVRFLAEAEFERAENDDAGFAAFHEAFVKENYHGMFQNRLRLRRLFDEDIALMERWLKAPHVAKWYLHPGHWLRELRERHGVFSFITHFIAEYESVPIGFCQYYDCYYAQEHEVWNEQWRTGERTGELFSLDYLVGEPEYLRRGFGKAMIQEMLDRLRRINAKTIIVQPEQENTSSCRVLETCGFQYDGEVYVMDLKQNHDS